MSKQTKILGVTCTHHRGNEYSTAWYKDLKKLVKAHVAIPTGEGSEGHFFDLVDPVKGVDKRIKRLSEEIEKRQAQLDVFIKEREEMTNGATN